MNRESNDLLSSPWNKAISVTFELTPADSFVATYTLKSRMVTQWLSHLLVGVLPLFLICWLWFVTDAHDSFFICLVVILLVLPVFVFVIHPLIVWSKINRTIRSTPAAQGPRTVTWSDEGMSTTTEVSHVELKWSTFVKAVETKRFFFFFLSPLSPRQGARRAGREGPGE